MKRTVSFAELMKMRSFKGRKKKEIKVRIPLRGAKTTHFIYYL